MAGPLYSRNPGRAERRKAPRFVGEQAVSVTTIKGPVELTMVDVSLTGCRTRNFSRLPLPKSVTLKVVDFSFEIRAETVWNRGSLTGWRFRFEPDQEARVRQSIEVMKVRTFRTAESPRTGFTGARRGGRLLRL